MALSSMTGFARATGMEGVLSWTWEVRSVNGKGLDARLRLPQGMEALEPEIRKALAARFRRGNMQISLQLEITDARSAMRVNKELLEWLVEEARKTSARLGTLAANVDPARLLSMRGVLEAEDSTARAIEEHHEAMMASFGEALSALAEMRSREGQRLEKVIIAQLDEIAALVEQARNDPARAPEAIRERLREQVARIMEAEPELDEQRLHQEAMLLAARADIAEELDRLDAHVEAARELVDSSGPAGRRLEFLAQEFNREANTLCSKSNAASITRAGLEMKAIIDRLKEQAANIE